MVYNSPNDLAPEYLRSKLDDRSQISSCSIRDCQGMLTIPLPLTYFLTIVMNSFSCRDAVLWNRCFLSRCSKHKLNFKSDCSSVFNNSEQHATFSKKKKAFLHLFSTFNVRYAVGLFEPHVLFYCVFFFIYMLGLTCYSCQIKQVIKHTYRWH